MQSNPRTTWRLFKLDYNSRKHMSHDNCQTLAGIIADTHGLMRPEALKALQGCDLIIHAGDVGKPDVLDALRQIAPVTAIRGNVDHGAWAEALPLTAFVEVAGVRLYILHDLNDLDLALSSANFDAVISGHSHKPVVQVRDGVLLLNPGSAGPRRFSLPVSMARLRIVGGKLHPTLLELQPSP
jgi:uncharacterized protein